MSSDQLKRKNKSNYKWIKNESYNDISELPEKVSKIITIPKAGTYKKNRNSSDKEGNGAPLGEKPPELLLQKILDAINSAKDFICISSFVIGNQRIEDAIVNASNRDVRIYLLTASETHLNKSELTEEDIKNIQKHIKFLQKMQGVALIRTSQDFHLKCVIVDPKNCDRKKGFLLTCNLTGAISHSPDIGITLNSSQIDVLFHQFLIGFYRMAMTENRGHDGLGDLTVMNPSIPVNVPLLKKTKAGMLFTIKQSSVSQSSESDMFKLLSLKDELIKFIQKTEGEIKVFAWKFEEESEVVNELTKALDNGRKITVIARVNEKNWKVNSGLEILANSGAKIIAIPYFHAKGIISSTKGKKRAIVMTSNYELAGLDYGFNTGIRFNEKDQAEKIELLFDEWCRCGKYRLEKKQKKQKKSKTKKA